ncbi:MAG: type II secretion system protein GspK [Pacificimonas sp.]
MRGVGTGDEGGIVLVNVLAVLALASAIILIMVSAQDSATLRSSRFAEAAQALAIAEGGELSAISALRRDALAEDSDVDHRGEAWAAIEETDAPVEGGSFTLRIEDAQARYNLANMVPAGSAGIFPRIAEAAGIDRAEGARIELAVRTAGGIDDMTMLSRLGVTAGQLRALAPFVTVLPRPTRVNLNNADEALLAALFDDPLAARLLIERRNRQGFVTREDVRALKAVAPFGTSFRSDYFRVQSGVRIGATRQVLTSLLERRGKRVSVIERKRGSGDTLSDAAALQP